MEPAFLKAGGLPEPEEEAIASILLQEMEPERRRDALFARPESAEPLSRMADDAAGLTSTHRLFHRPRP